MTGDIVRAIHRLSGTQTKIHFHVQGMAEGYRLGVEVWAYERKAGAPEWQRRWFYAPYHAGASLRFHSAAAALTYAEAVFDAFFTTQPEAIAEAAQPIEVAGFVGGYL